MTVATSSAVMTRPIETSLPSAGEASSSEMPFASATFRTTGGTTSVMVSAGWTTSTLMPCGPEFVGEVLRQRRDRDVADRAHDRAGPARREPATLTIEPLSAADRERLGAMARAIASRLLHEPTLRVKDAAEREDAYLYVTALRELFGLDAGTEPHEGEGAEVTSLEDARRDREDR